MCNLFSLLSFRVIPHHPRLSHLLQKVMGDYCGGNQYSPPVAEHEVFLRYNQNNKERVGSFGTTVGLSPNWAMRFEGLLRKSDNYRVPGIRMSRESLNDGLYTITHETIDYLPDSHNQSAMGTFGVSYLFDGGYLGASASQRKDNYGLIGHNHRFDECHGHIMDPFSGVFAAHPVPYLQAYPQLMGDEHLSSDPHFHCGQGHDQDPNPSHDHVYGHHHDHTQGGPVVDIRVKRYDVRGEISDPVSWLDNAKLSLTYSDYHHSEVDNGKHLYSPTKGQEFLRANDSFFDNQGINSRVQVQHKPV